MSIAPDFVTPAVAEGKGGELDSRAVLVGNPHSGQTAVELVDLVPHVGQEPSHHKQNQDKMH